MVAETRGIGGVPVVFNGTIDNTGQERRVKAATKWLYVANVDATNDLRVYFTEEDFTADANFLTIPQGEFREFPAEVAKLYWLRSAVGTVDVEIAEFSRRG